MAPAACLTVAAPPECPHALPRPSAGTMASPSILPTQAGSQAGTQQACPPPGMVPMPSPTSQSGGVCMPPRQGGISWQARVLVRSRQSRGGACSGRCVKRGACEVGQSAVALAGYRYHENGIPPASPVNMCAPGHRTGKYAPSVQRRRREDDVVDAAGEAGKLSAVEGPCL